MLLNKLKQLKQILQIRKTKAEIEIGNTIEYNTSSYQVKKTIVKIREVRLEGL